ncbi:MAG: TVP38/TMEM64 family protein [Myxococcales bacterium]|nr:TVP38/TMEM64 family protein [Myxococcales bacterium]
MRRMPAMKRYWLIAGGMMGLMLALFGVVEALGVPLLTDPAPWMNQGGPIAAAVGVGLLVADVVLPVPSSLVMVAHGALFGVVIGAALSLVGSVGSAALAFAIGRRGGPWLHRLVTADERARADRLLARYGGVAIMLSRPLPLLAETVALLAGTSPMGFGRAMVAATVGSLPPSILYAVTGASAMKLDDQLLIMGAVFAVTGVAFAVARAVERRL